MSRKKPRHRPIVGLAVLTSIALLVWSLPGPGLALAQAPPPPSTPTFTPTPTHTNTPVAALATPTYTNTPVTASATPTHTDTPIPPTPTQTHTPVPPTTTHTPTPQSPTQPEHSNTPGSSSNPKPNPDCKTLVEGHVLDAAGQPAQGATVHIKGAGWSNAMMTDDNGAYGFGGLCAGAATLQAYLLSGQATQIAQVNLDGKNSVSVDLRVQPVGAAIATHQPTPQPMLTVEPDMPATGYSGLLLVGAALLGALLLILAGTRRALGVEEQRRNGD